MKIEIGDRIIIEKEDSKNWIVKQRVIGKSRDGSPKTSWPVEGYYSSLENACRGVLELKSAASNSIHRDVSSAVSELRSLWSDILLSTRPYDGL